ncbi:MAG: putative Ig domain-containing protein [Gammaproteobacteria bacterium]
MQQSNVGTTSPPAGTSTPPNTATSPGTNTAPTISGTPSAQAAVGQTYTFKPLASDRDGDALAFSIGNRPAWSTFNPTTGQLSGMPSTANVGTYKGVTIIATAGGISVMLQPFDIQVIDTGGPTVGTPTPTNTPPSIGGTPAPQALVDQVYTFSPSASDPDGDALTFSIANMPSWATFNTATGRLTGTPTAANVGTYTAVSITVTAGGQSKALQPFNIQVVDNGAKSVTLSWMPPTENEDGTALLNLAGYRIRYGNQAGDHPNVITLNNPGLTTYVVEGLVPNDYYFVMMAYNVDGVRSALSNEALFDLN